jgi:hypothetical protein
MTTNVTVPASVVTRILHLPITSDAEAFATVAHASERLLVQLGAPGAEHRSALASFIVAAVEAQLQRLGAAPRGWRTSETLDSILSDQLYRARLLGSAGIALRFDSLRALADSNGHLGPDDSSTLRELVHIAAREPLQVYLPRQCAELVIAGDPQPLSAWLPPSLEPGRVATIEYDPPGEPSLSEAAPVPPANDAGVLLPPPVEAFFEARPGSALAADFGDSAAEQAEPPEAAPSAATGAASEAGLGPSASDAIAAAVQAGDAEWFAATAELGDDAADAERVGGDSASGDSASGDSASGGSASGGSASGDSASDDSAGHEREVEAAAAASEAFPCEVPGADALTATASHAAVESDARPFLDSDARPAAASIDPARLQRCSSWAAQLQTMSGPKVHGSVEKAFITAYLPLCREVASGAAPLEAQAAAQRWAEGFAQSYASAFRQLGSRARRPRMVRDVIDVGIRWLTQHQARQCQLLLVSAMRFDLGQRLNEELERRLAGAAACVDQCVLWTALPSNAEAQLLAGDVGMGRRLRQEPDATPSALPAIEPLCVGNRQLFKLNHVPQELPRAGEAEPQRLERVARELADVIAPWMLHQPPDTLVVVFGDHGFHWDSTPLGTTAAQRGGALPEQVLVPASGWQLQQPRSRAARLAAGLH